MKQAKSLEEYISTVPMEVSSKLEEIRKVVIKEVPEIEETIRYGMPTFNLHGIYVIYFAAWKKHISIYPFSSSMEKKFKEAQNYKTSGKGTIQFPLDKPLPLSLIRKIIQFRVKEVKNKEKK